MKVQLEAQTAKLARTETDLTEVNGKLSSSQEKNARLDAEVKAKVSCQLLLQIFKSLSIDY